MIIRLKTATEAEMFEALSAVLPTDEDGELVTATHNYFVSLIGELQAPTGVMLIDDEGNEYPEKAALDGFHANLVTNDSKIIAALAGITITVNAPLIKIAGE